MTSFCRVLHKVRVAASLRKCFHQSFQWLPSSRSSTVPQTFSLLPGNIKPVQAHAYNALCQYAYLQRLPIGKAKLFKVIGCKHIFWFLWSSSEQCASIVVITSTTIPQVPSLASKFPDVPLPGTATSTRLNFPAQIRRKPPVKMRNRAFWSNVHVLRKGRVTLAGQGGRGQNPPLPNRQFRIIQDHSVPNLEAQTMPKQWQTKMFSEFQAIKTKPLLTNVMAVLTNMRLEEKKTSKASAPSKCTSFRQLKRLAS